MTRHTGKVAWFDSGLGYVFLSAEGMVDVFCYLAVVEGVGYPPLRLGEVVEFNVSRSTEGTQAECSTFELGTVRNRMRLN